MRRRSSSEEITRKKDTEVEQGSQCSGPAGTIEIEGFIYYYWSILTFLF